MHRKQKLFWRFLVALSLLLAVSVQAAPITVKAFGDYGWKSDDTRTGAGVDLVGVNYTNAGKPGQLPTLADDAAIAQQIKFLTGPAGATYPGAIEILAPLGNPGKSNISDIDLAGFAPASDLVGGGFSATYKWYMEPNPTVRTLAFKLGIQSIHWGTGPGQSQNGFTAIRSGESAWDLVLVTIEPAPVANAWNTPVLDMNNGLWNLYAQAGNGNWTPIVGAAPPGGATSKTLAAWQADATWGPVLFGVGSKITSVQFGLGSGQQSCNAYLDYFQASIYNGGDVVDFAGPIKNVNTGETFATIQEAVDDAETLAGHTIEVSAGTYVLGATTNINKANLTIDGAGAGSTIVQAASSIGYAFTVSAAGVTIKDIELQKTDLPGVHNLILVNGNNCTIQNCLIYGPDPGMTWAASGIVSRAFEVAGGLTGLLIDGNTIHHLRQPAYINPGTVGTVSNNAVSATRGWVSDGANIAFINNTWPAPINQASDIALLASVNPIWYPSLLALSNANNNAYIDAQWVGGEKGRATAYVDDSAPLGGDGSATVPYQLVSLGVGGVLTGGTVLAAPGSYADEVEITKSMTVTGSGIDVSTIVGLKAGVKSATVRVAGSGNVVFEGFTVTRDGNNVADWGANVKVAGLAIQGPVATAVIRNNKFTGNRTAIDLNNVSGHTIRNNILDFNRSGLILRNQCPNITFEENEVTNNWTVGILWLNASTEDATGTVFFNNKIEGNWYTQIENRSLTGGVKNFSGNWLGSTTLTTTNTNGSEPGYAAQIPVAYGGSATNPGGAYSVRGVGIADMDYTPWLGSGTDTNFDNGNGTVGFQGDFSVLYADDDNGQYGTINRVQEAVNLVSGSTIYLMPGTFVGQVVASGFSDLDIIGSGIGTTILQAPAVAMTHAYVTSANNYAILSVENSADVDVSNLTIDGAGKGNLQYRFVGAGYFESGGSLTDVNILDVRNSPLDGGQHGVSVYAYSAGGTPRTLDLLRVATSGFQKTAMVFAGADLTANLDDCDILGPGPLGLGLPAQNGIQFSSSADGSINACTISDISYTNPSWAACGLLLFGPATIQVTNNIISDVGVGAYFIDAGGSFVGNTYSATIAGTGIAGYYGVFFANDNVSKSKTPKAQPYDESDKGFSQTNESLAPLALTIPVNGNTVSGDLGTGSYGIGASTGGVGNLVVNMSGNRVTGFDYAISMGAGTGTSLTSSLTNSEVLFNNVGFENYGGVTSVTQNAFSNTTNATDDTPGNFYDMNCWHDWSGVGPYAIGGGGGNADANPRTDCGLDMSPNTIVYNCSGNFNFTVGVGTAVTALDAANIWIEYPAELTVASVTALDANYFMAYTQTTDILNTRDTLKVNLGVLTGIVDGPEDLFSIAMNGSASCLSGDIVMIYRDLRDSTNSQIIVPLASAIDFQSNCADPVIVVNSPVSGGFYNTNPVLSLTATDDCDLNNVYYQIDGCTPGGWQLIAGPLAGTVYNNATWSMTPAEFAALSEASHCIRFRVTDDFGRENANQCSYTWCFTKDITAPLPPTLMSAQPGHNKVNLSWVNSTSTDVVGVKIQRTPWTDYPEYGSSPTPTPAPSYPPNHTVGTTVHTAAASPGLPAVHIDVSGLSNATRDIYYYGAFAYDAAGNYSTAAVSAQARSTSYWLGDIAVAFDGNVYFADLVSFSSTYGLNQGQPGFNNHADFGPTHNFSPKGIPLPDDKVEFEDLAIFAINFNNVAPMAPKNVPILSGDTQERFAGLRIVDRRASDGYYVDFYLDNPNRDAKSLIGEIAFNSTQMTLVSVLPSDAVSAASAPVFFKPIFGEDHVSVSVAALGQGTTFVGSGLIATAKFELRSTSAAKPKLTRVEIRNNENQSLIQEVAFETQPETISTEETSGEFTIQQNSPNPFNPETRIAYSLPKSTQVSIRIYNVMGQLVKSLVDGYQQAGTHEVVWNGTNDSGTKVASGIYFYRFETPEFQKTVKMTMLK